MLRQRKDKVARSNYSSAKRERMKAKFGVKTAVLQSPCIVRQDPKLLEEVRLLRLSRLLGQYDDS
jgi:hypothetical protein